MKSTKRRLVESILSDLTSKEPTYLLSDFFGAEGNVFARKLFESLLEENEPQLGFFNPIYLWGPSGCGKTHLMIGTAASLRKKSYQVLYATCDAFTGAVLRAIRSECLNEFQHELRSCSVLMIDEISDLSDRWRIQEEFFHAFNTLRTEGKQIILSSQIAPHQLVAVENRLISRFEWGLLVPMTRFTEEEQGKHLKTILECKGFRAEQTVYPKLAKIFGQDMKKLTHWLDTLPTRRIKGQELETLFKETALQRPAVNFQDILKSVSSHFRIEQNALLGPSQKKSIAIPRRIAMYLCRTLLHLPMQKIGHAFGRDNTTVSLSCKTISELLSTDEELQQQIEQIKRSLPS
ncbi:DnaA ATPase domain-containing protein [Candidatus Similichlamydia laticola]|uniref:Chromosomal replication initiator protein DnaA n=1 Tax=Candidatus Similichlamydia laticola TaxID=2170265 RepID=A0A369KA96_9BACT|nr:DnaA/Hda family protein [Candidatus Similichlamydia laticola]RDB31519.1 Chromosomal replication initiator protein DnaA [Candidatus Similichlamydia laticola]